MFISRGGLKPGEKRKMAELNWSEEAGKLKDNNDLESLDWFRPEEGKKTIKILQVCNEYTKIYEDKEITKVRIEIEVDGKKLNWGVAKREGKKSIWGQLVELGKLRGKLEGESLTLLIKGRGRNVSYTVPEVLSEKTAEEIVM